MSAPSPGASICSATITGAALIFLPVGCHQKVTIGNVEKHYSKYLGYQEKFDQHLWGVSTGPDHNLDHIEMTVHFDPGEEFVLHRLGARSAMVQSNYWTHRLAGFQPMSMMPQRYCPGCAPSSAAL